MRCKFGHEVVTFPLASRGSKPAYSTGSIQSLGSTLGPAANFRHTNIYRKYKVQATVQDLCDRISV